MNRPALAVPAQLACLAVGLLVVVSPVAADPYVPWTPLTQDLHPDQATYPGELAQPAWIGPGAVTVYAHTAAGAVAPYALGFNDARNGDAAGNDSVLFRYGGQESGRLVGATADTFFIRNGGGSKGGSSSSNRTFTDMLLLVAIDASSLPADFAFSVRKAGEAAYTRLDSSHFVWYDPTLSGLDYATGRPSGNHGDYRQVIPAGQGGTPALVEGSYDLGYSEPLAYDFDNGMVSIFALEDINVTDQSDPGNNIKGVDYAFENLPARAVFSLYGYRDGKTGQRIKRTNQALPRLDGDPSDPFTTFEVLPVPEPASVLLLLFGAAFCGRCNRRV